MSNPDGIVGLRDFVVAWGATDGVPPILSALDTLQTSYFSRVPLLAQQRKLKALQSGATFQSQMLISLRRIRAEFIGLEAPHKNVPKMHKKSAASNTTVVVDGVVISVSNANTEDTPCGAHTVCHRHQDKKTSVCIGKTVARMDVYYSRNIYRNGLRAGMTSKAVAWQLQVSSTNVSWDSILSLPHSRDTVAAFRCAVTDIFFCARDDFPRALAVCTSEWGEVC